MHQFIRGCIVSAFFLAPTAVQAAHPFQVEDTFTQGKGNYVFELNGDYLKDKQDKTTLMAGVLKAGLGDNVDVSVEAPYRMLAPSPVTGLFANGPGDVQVKLKYRVYENEVNQSVGLQLYTGLPVGDSSKGLGTDNVITGIQLMDQQACGNNILHVSASYEAFARDLRSWHFDEDYAVRYGFALEHKLTESFRVLAELAGEVRTENEMGHTFHPFTGMAGFLYDISRSWYVDLAVRTGLNADAEDYAALAGTAWRF